jgi:hypothetical protein
MIIRVGNQISSDLGYDFFVCGDGDYYGHSTASLSKDIIYSGYNNGACTFTQTASSVFMTYSRDVFTFDTFDASIGRSATVCLIGTEYNCATLTLPLNIPSLAVSSALSISEPHLAPIVLLTLTLLLMLSLA